MKNTYTPEALGQLAEAYDLCQREARDALTELIAYGAKLTSARAQEYLHHGVGRRLGILRRCVEMIFEICPLDRSALFEREELVDLNIYLHAFLVNVYGLLDNIAWVVVFEATGNEVKRRQDIGLFYDEVQQHLSPQAADFLKTMKPWHDNYMKNFRDSLAHRIPAYVPPMKMTEAEAQRYQELDRGIFEHIKAHDFTGAEALEEEQCKLGKLNPIYTHSFGDHDRGFAYLHSQAITDLRTMVAILRAAFLDAKTAP